MKVSPNPDHRIQKPQFHSTSPIPYNLDLLAFEGEGLAMVLKSPLLDPVLHPKRLLRTWIAREVKSGAYLKTAGRFILDKFALESLLQYLREQGPVRRILEYQLTRDRKNWNQDREFNRSDIWAHTKLLTVQFDKKNVPTADGLLNMKTLIPKLNIERVIEISDKTETRSCFTIQLRVAWDNEHRRLVKVRDGQFVEMAAE